ADGARAHWQFDRFVGSVAECESGGLIVALADRIVHFRPEAGPSALREIAVLETDRPRNRLNDGKADPWGGFWVGSMEIEEQARTGRLWRVRPDGDARCVRDNIGVSNSLSIDPDRGRIYFADSMAGVIECADLDQHHLPKTWRLFARAQAGSPDGSVLDSAGCLWNAEWNGRRLTRYTPDGAVDRVVEIPTGRPSCPAFGGNARRTLLVTTANYKMSAAERQRDPDAGAVFLTELDDVQGLPPYLFAL
ncbi:MAG TPA: SMP-30/gluconolactonase/LRE family protein, partial [Polyangia bacterium]|nr:SMP-30/gluconolactonase/LRE family protein [Polyangia bacterium]